LRKLAIHDTLTSRLTELQAREPGVVGIYACGPTVYGRVHVGNARPFVTFSLLKRFLQHEGLQVRLVANITDVNDKIYAAAHARGIGSAELAQEMAQAYIADTDRLGVGRPDREPLASRSIEGIVALIEELVARGHAYAAGGDVYFSVRSYPAYGELSHRRLEEMDQGEGGEGSERKRDPQDFALWKAEKPGEDTAWPSPWGAGRPGWHIECSAMAEAELGLDFEIHGGGSDLIFPHHENEAAQTAAARGRRLARIWMHNGMVRLRDAQTGEGAKMAKSVGNIFLLHDALDRYGRDALLMFFCGGHYRQPVDFDDERLEEAVARVARVRELARRTRAGASPAWSGALRETFFAALASDFNLPRALAALFDWVREANRQADAGDPPGHDDLREMLGVLALSNLLESEDGSVPERVVALRDAREQARQRRDWAAADRLRDELAALGWTVRDGPAGPELLPRRHAAPGTAW
jgi:cysteinyl-tRNA synthetase